MTQLTAMAAILLLGYFIESLNRERHGQVREEIGQLLAADCSSIPGPGTIVALGRFGPKGIPTENSCVWWLPFWPHLFVFCRFRRVKMRVLWNRASPRACKRRRPATGPYFI
jgi:hypothetical protein